MSEIVMFKEVRLPKQICVLCGEREATKKGDHLPPKNLYPRPRKPNVELHKVPACSVCNNPASKHDEEFKIIIGFTTGEFRENQDAIINSIGKTIGVNKRIARQIFSTHKKTYADRGSGIAEPVVQVEFNFENYSNVVSRMVRGLYWRETHSIMAKDTTISVWPTIGMKKDIASNLQELMSYLEPRKLNDGTFIYKVFFGKNGLSVWGMQFFGKHTVFAYTEPNEHNKKMQPTAESAG
ncbi:MAG: hypothetical protein WAV07_09715 [Candidatus Contendobacter sp.]